MYIDFRYSNKPYAEYVGQYMNYIFIKWLENIFPSIDEWCQKFVQEAQIFFVPNILYLVISVFKTFSLSNKFS